MESAAATVLINSEIGRVCIITVCGGSDMKRWLPLIEQIESYARAEGCKRVAEVPLLAAAALVANWGACRGRLADLLVAVWSKRVTMRRET